ncbi:hypothetical protein OH76DRAFT_578839 [Lentinus brumalis]|uniref:Uncharacterized protein n=1 Tax=Lentinus brumalis TaxID=2498619 RepID=A0A371DTN2_9APHY|nr:hypothetical protein OH76DRAFT_578839 [Polyporus brumalis]
MPWQSSAPIYLRMIRWQSLSGITLSSPTYCSNFFYIVLSIRAPAWFEGRVGLLLLRVQKVYREYDSSLLTIEDEASMTSSLVKAVYRHGYAKSRHVILRDGKQAMSLFDQRSAYFSELSLDHRHKLQSLTGSLGELMALVEGVDAGDAGNGHLMKVYYRSVLLAAGLDDDEFVDELDNPGTYFVLDGQKRVVAMQLTVKSLGEVIKYLTEFHCNDLSWTTTIIGGPGGENYKSSSDSVPVPTLEEIQRWCLEFLQASEDSEHDWAVVFADLPNLVESDHPYAAARHDIHAEVVLLQYIATHDIAILPDIATSTDTMCFACYKLLLAVSARRSVCLRSSSCDHMVPFPLFLPALPSGVKGF